ncbi:hypothetical protein X975_15280, partial [Stegodyphus mimosarum]
MPGTRCSVAVCNNTYIKTKCSPDTKDMTYHKFPSNQEVRSIWIQRCR